MTIQGYRLSPQQEHLCRVRQRSREAGWTAWCRVEIEGATEAALLRRALEQVIARHEILRTTFHQLPGLTFPVQVVGENISAYLWTEHDLAGLAAAESEAALAQLAEEARATAFDLARGPLVRADLARLGDGRSALLLSLPALAADLASLRILAGEIACAYGGGSSPEEREPPFQYADAAEILHEWKAAPGAGTLSASLRHGTPRRPSGRAEALAPAPPRTVSATLTDAAAEAVAHLSGQLGAPLSVLLLAAWNATLWYSTGEADLRVGTAFEGRTVAEMESALGLFVRYLPVRCEVGPHSTLRQMVEALAPRLAELAEIQDGFPLEALEEQLTAGGGTRARAFGFDCEPPAAPGSGTPLFTFGGGSAEADRFELRLSVLAGSPLRSALHYDPQLFSRSGAERLLGRFVQVLDRLVAAPDLALAELDVLSAEERQELVESFNNTAAPFPEDRCCHELFEDQARRIPQATALVSGEDHVTFAELNARANGLARHLAALGVAPESLVGLCLERSADLVVSLLAILKAGGAYVPLDPGYPAEHLAFLQRDAGLQVLLTREGLLPRLAPPPGTRVLCLDCAEERRQVDRQPAADLSVATFPESPAYMIYTSGSTGRPKGVMVPHRGLVNYLCWARRAYRAADGPGAPVHSALGFDLTVTSLLTPLISGTAVTLLPEEQGVGGLAAALRARRGFSLVKVTPAHLEVLRQVMTPAEATGAARALVIGGEALRAEGLSFWREASPAPRLINEYGPTETVVGCCVYEVRSSDPASGPVPIGRPIANARLYTTGPLGHLVVAGVPGELWIGGTGVTRGYLNRPGLTAERFVPDPFSGRPGDRLYRTGDLVRLREDGELEFLGRIDEQVKVRGFRIEPGEIEVVLATHPDVREAAVVAHGDAGNRRLVAYAVFHGAAQPGTTELRSFLASKLPEHMIPAAFVPLDALPLTAHGKLDRRALPEPPARSEEEAYAPPRTLEEDLMAEILAGALDARRVGIDDNFFSLGGDSIRSMRVLSLARERGLTLSLQDLFRHPTIRGLAPFLRTGAAEAAVRTEPFSLISPADRERLPAGLEDAYPLPRLQAGMLFQSAYRPESAVYHDTHSFHLRGVWERDLLQAAVDRVVRRHPVLRTSFDLSSFGEPIELVHRDVRLGITVDDLRDLPDGEQSATVGAWLDAERHRGFDGARPPLVRFHVHLRSAETFQLTLSFHHAVLDGWSAASLLTELFRIYTELVAGLPQREEPVPQATFRDFVELERRALASAESQGFWRRQLEGTTLSRLARWPAPASPRQAGDHIVPVPADVTDGLRRLARSVSVPLKSVLLAAHLKVMSVWTGLSDVTTGMVVNGRPEWGGGDQVLGLFLNTVPCRFRLGRETWEELAHRAFEMEWVMLPHRRFPMAELQTMQGGGPLFETLFNFLHFHVYQEVRQELAGLTVLDRSSYEEMDLPLGCNFQLDPGGSRLLVRLNYVAGELAPEQVTAMADCYARLLADMAWSPVRSHLDAPVLSAEEKEEILNRWSHGGPVAGPAVCLHELFAAQAVSTPHHPALIGAGRTLTYAELDAAAGALSRRLRAFGAGPERLVGLCAGRGPGLVIGALAILKAGSAYVPLDPAYPAERLAFTLSDSGAPLVLTERRLLATLPSGEARVVCLEEEGEPSAGPPEGPEVGPGHLAYVIYTSGSTGRPKGAAIPHRAAAALVSWAVAAFPREDFAAVLASTSICFDLSVFEIFVPLACGGTVVLAENALALRDWREKGVTLVNTVPSAMAELLRTGGLPESIRAVGLAGEPLQRPLVEAIHDALPGSRVYNLYGPSEDTTYSTWALMPRGESPAPPVGRPVAGGCVYILDEQLGPVPAGVLGEIWLGGAGLARGYLGHPGLTAERFLPCPFSQLPGDRLYRTGDLGRFRQDGVIELLGRIDQQVKVRGYRIELGEIEAALLRLPGVREAAVMVRSGAGGDPSLVAWVVLRAEVGHPEERTRELREALREWLPEPMIPTAWVVLDRLPLTPNGKVDRRRLPQPERPAPAAPAVPPRGPVEEALAALWQEVLGVSLIGVRDNFFALGGHSLLASRIVSRVQATFRVEVPLRALFDHPTVAGLADVVEAALRGTAGPAAPPLEARDREGDPPLSFAQQRLWIVDQLEPGSAAYNLPLAVRLIGRLDRGALDRGLGEVVARHESLRTTFPLLGTRPVQRIAAPEAWRLPLVDLGGLTPERRERETRQWTAAEALRPFDLARGPLLRGALLRLDGREHVLLLTLHHIITDAWSMGVLVRELAVLYTALLAGRPSLLPPLPVQYADFARWQREWLQGEVLAEQISYWKQRMTGAPPTLDLPADRPRPTVPSGRGGARAVLLPPGVSSALAGLARREGATPFMVLLTAFDTLLHRYTEREDIVVGTDIANRNRTETESLIGFFVNQLVLRSDLSGDPSSRTLLARVRETALEAYAHQDLPFERLVEELHPERDLSRPPVFQITFGLQNVPADPVELADLSFSPLSQSGGTAKFDLGLTATETPAGLRVGAEHSLDLFDAPTIDRLLQHYATLLGGALDQPGLPLSQLSLLTEAERHQVGTEWNDSAAGFPGGDGETTFHRLFEKQVAAHPEAVAALDDGGRLTYRELNTQSDLLARRLAAHGVGAGCVVALVADRGKELLIAILAAFKVGAAYLPLDPLDPGRRLVQLLRDSGAPALLAAQPYAGALRRAIDEELAPGGPRLLVLEDALAGEEEAGPDPGLPGRRPEGLAYVIYTSGSTGLPKGAMVEQRGMLNHLWAKVDLLGLTDRDVVAQTASQCFDISVWQFLAVLLAGGRIHVFPDEVTHDPLRLLGAVDRRGVTVLEVVPSLFRLMLDEIEARGEMRPSLARLRWVIPTGEALPPELCRRWFRLYPDIPLANAYGPTECSDDVTHHVLRAAPDPGKPSTPIGRPAPNLRLYALDRGMQPLPVGVPGELYVGGAGVGRGYLRDGSRTAAAWSPDPFSHQPGNRLYRTGDLARLLPDGRIDFLGRIDHQVKVRGNRIEPREIESVLAAHPSVGQAAVVAREDTPGDRRLVAYVLPTVPGTPTEGLVSQLRAFVADRLPDFMMPAAFLLLDAFPLTPNGKLDRKALPAPEWSATDRHLAPRTPIEEILAGIWDEVLGLEGIGVDGHFFDLGGHSLLAAQVMSRLRNAFDIELPLRDLFEAPVLGSFASRVEAALQDGAAPLAPPLVPAPRQGPVPLSFAQQRLWFIDQLEPGSSLYNIPLALHVEGPLRAEVLALCLGEIERRHEVLRTVVPAAEGTPVQVVRPAEPFSLSIVDVSALPQEKREAHALALSAEEADRPFDLTRGPLLRALLLRLAADENIVVVTVHHIAGDGWSMGILVREITSLYQAFSGGMPSPLPELPVQYTDFAAWQRSWLQGEIVANEISFWRRQLAGLPSRLALPTDHPRPAVQSFRGSTRPVRLSPELARQVRALGRGEGVTLFMVLLAGFQALLARYSGQSDLAVGTPVAGRDRIEVERLIGFFVNTLVLRGDLTGEGAGGPSFQELLRRVREAALAAHAHQNVPFERLVQELAPERSLAQSPLFQVLFALQNAPAETLDIPGLRLRPSGGARTTAKFDLSLALEERDGGFSGAVEYATDLFDATTIDRLIDHFGRLLTAAVADPALSAFTLPLLSRTESRQILVEWNDTGTMSAPGACLHELFEAQVRRTPEAVALVAGTREISYGELNRAAERLAGPLRHRGIGPEVVVGVYLERSFDMVTALLAILKARAAYLPLDPQQPRLRLAGILASAKASAVVSHSQIAGQLPWTGPLILVDRDAAESRDGRAGDRADPESLAYVLYTSGSTGTPKGVAVTHRSAVELVRWAGTVYAPEELAGVLASTSLSFDLSVFELFVPLSWGGTVILAQNVLELPTLPCRERVTLVNTVPSAMSELVHAGNLGASVRTVNLAGEPLQRSLADRIYATGMVERVLNLYGPSEDTTYSTFAQVGRQSTAAPGIGRPIASTKVYVLSAGQDPVPAGVAGELYLAGAGLARGYLHRPDLTAERFLPDPFATGPGARLYRTGDLVRWTVTGELEFLGRLDHQVKIRGFRIEIGEVEAALRAEPGVREAAVAAREDRPGDRRLVAYVVGDVAADALRRSLQERLPGYMVPTVFLMLEALPLTPHGKVDRNALPAPERQRPQEGTLAPRPPVEEVLGGIWAELLGLERVGALDHFFDLGGHSLLATQVMSRVQEAFDVELPLRDLFEAPRLADFAARVEAARQSDQAPLLSPLVPGPRGGDLPLSFAQQRLLFMALMAPGDPSYNLPLGLRLDGRLDTRALRLTLDAVIARHEPLRTTFRVDEIQVAQVIAPTASLPLPLVDLAGLPAGIREMEARRIFLEQARHSFDLLRGPVVIALLARLAPAEHLLLMTVHHIAADGWSCALLYRDTAELYRAIVEGRRSLLPELPVQYADFAAWQRATLQEAGLERHLDYWRTHLAGAPALVLPADRIRPPRPSGRGATLPLALPAETVAAARRLAREEAATFFMVLIGAFSVLLHHASGADDLSIGTDIANRNRRETEDLIGLFANQLVLRNDLSGNPTFRDLLRRVRRTTLNAYAHQDAPFDRLVEALNPVRDLGSTPLFQVKLVLQNVQMPVHEITDLKVSPFSVNNHTAKFDLLLNLVETGDAVLGVLEYNDDIWEEASMARLLRDFAAILAAGTSRTDERIDRIEEDLSRPSPPPGAEIRTILRRRAISVSPA